MAAMLLVCYFGGRRHRCHGRFTLRRLACALAIAALLISVWTVCGSTTDLGFVAGVVKSALHSQERQHLATCGRRPSPRHPLLAVSDARRVSVAAAPTAEVLRPWPAPPTRTEVAPSLRAPGPYGSPEATANIWRGLAKHAEPQVDLLAASSPGPDADSPPIPVRVVDDFIPPDDARGLVDLADREGLWEATVTTAFNARGQPAARTAESAWMPDEHPLVQKLRKAGADAFGLTPEQVEPIRLLRYSDVNARFPPHVDWSFGGDDAVDSLGQRVASALVYLSDVPAGAGGTTWFPHYGLDVRPAAGRAAIWANVGPDGAPLYEVEHAAMPLREMSGSMPVKVAVNVWFRDRAVPKTGGSGAKATPQWERQMGVAQVRGKKAVESSVTAVLVFGAIAAAVVFFFVLSLLMG